MHAKSVATPPRSGIYTHPPFGGVCLSSYLISAPQIAVTAKLPCRRQGLDPKKVLADVRITTSGSRNTKRVCEPTKLRENGEEQDSAHK